MARRRGAVALLELVEDPVEAMRLDAGAGVADGENEPVVPARQAQADTAVLGELHRVAGEVHHDLPQTGGVAAHDGRNVALDEAGDLDALALGAGGEQLDDALDEARQRDGFVGEVEAAGLDLREVEDFVEDGEQRFARRLDGAGVGRLLGVEARAGEEAGHAEHAVERRADLVADGGEEARLRLAGGLGAAAGLGELGLDAATVGDVAADCLDLRALASAHGGLHPGDPAPAMRRVEGLVEGLGAILAAAEGVLRQPKDVPTRLAASCPARAAKASLT